MIKIYEFKYQNISHMDMCIETNEHGAETNELHAFGTFANAV